MGMHYVNKLLLLNESDIMVKGQSPETSFADLWELAEEHGSMYQSEYEFPLCSVLGFTSERFDETILWDDYCEPNWLSENATWDQNLLCVFQSSGGLDEATALEFLQTNDMQAVTSKLESQAQSYLQNKDYYDSGKLLQTLHSLQGRDLPGFQPGFHFTQGGDDDSLDMRCDEKTGTGSRVLLELAFLWD